MTRTNNDELVEIALKIAEKDAAGNALRERASVCTDLTTRQFLEKEAWSMDDDICQLCTDMRNACLPIAT